MKKLYIILVLVILLSTIGISNKQYPQNETNTHNTGEIKMFPLQNPIVSGQKITNPDRPYTGNFGADLTLPKYIDNLTTVAPAQYAGGSGTGGTVNPYQDKIDILNAQLGQLPGLQNTGLGNIANSYNSSYNKLTDQFGRAQRDYGIGKADTEQGFQTARNTVASNTRARLASLQRLLGIAGSGNSSAATDAVPFAAAREGTQAIEPVQQNHATNRRNQDLALQDTKDSYKTSLSDLAQARFGQEQALKQSIAQTKADLLSRIQAAGGPDYNGQINDLLSQITQLSNQYKNPVLRVNDVAYKAPSLLDYILGGSSPAQQNQPGGDTIDPIFAPILDKNKDQLSNLVA